MYWEPDKECMDREELEQFQLERLQSTLNRVYAHVPFYRKKFDALGISPEDIGSLSDLPRLPFTTKEDVSGNYPYGLFAVPLREVVRIHASSGSTETSSVVGYTRNDIAMWSKLVARILVAGGVTKDDVVQVSFRYGLFTGGFGLHYGAERLGASVIPASSGNTVRQIQIMKDFKTTALVSTPSYAMLVADTIRELGIPISAFSLKYGLFGGEPWSEKMRREIQDALGIIATDNYGLSEVIGPGVSGECLERNGLHINEDHFLVEVIDSKTFQPVRPGETGELVITTLTKEAFPMVRYRTRDLTSLKAGDCPCGRTGRRMSRLTGRTDEMLIIRGMKVSPTKIESLLFEIEGQEPNYRIVIDRKGAMDEVTVLVEAAGEASFGQERRHVGRTVETIRKRLTHELGVTVDVKLVEKKALEPVDGKAMRVIDLRKL
ncbi:phenylacetate--CoA ligase family protein [Candidatus Deferrimicrobium sp.]|uniref:phenylacetate--CoA ligase family protein n=1 Tax=Candidatus Deferrimicrobium sp. TaxID=3060586 RepID=UPI003C4D1F17